LQSSPTQSPKITAYIAVLQDPSPTSNDILHLEKNQRPKEFYETAFEKIISAFHQRQIGVS